MTHPHGKHLIRGILNIVLVPGETNDWWPFERFSEVFFIIIILIFIIKHN